MRYADSGSAVRPWRPGRPPLVPPFLESGRHEDSALDFKLAQQPFAREVARWQRSGCNRRRLQLGAAPVGAVGPLLGKHVREEAEPDAIEQQAEDRRDAP